MRMLFFSPLQPARRGRELSTYQDVVGLDVGVQDVAPFEQLQGQEELLAVGAHGFDVKADVFAILLQHLSQIHAADDNVMYAQWTRHININRSTERMNGWANLLPDKLPERLKNKTEMLLVVEVPEES